MQQHPYSGGVRESAKSSALVRALNDLQLDFDGGATVKNIVDLSDFGPYLLNHQGRQRDLLHALEAINRLFEAKKIYADDEALVRLPLGGISFLLFEEAELWVDLVPATLLARTLRNLRRFEMAHFLQNPDPDVAALFSYMGRIFVDKAVLLVRALGADHPVFDEYVDVIAQTRKAPQLVSDFDLLPKSWKLVLQKYWRIGDWQNAPRLAGLRTVDWKKGERLVVECGACSDMDSGHRLGLSKKALRSQQSTLIYVGDFLVGALKYEGESSMLALNNLADKDGHLRIVSGMVYAISSRIIDELRGQYPHPAALHLDANIEFPVHPKISLLAPRCSAVSGPCFKNFIRRLIRSVQKPRS